MEAKQSAGVKLLRLPAVLEKTGNKRSTHYKRVTAGLFTCAVKCGERVAAWPESEVEAINLARVAGKSDHEIKELVAKLETDRMVLA